MSYKYESQYNSPNYSQGYESRDILIIHHWDAASNNPSYEGVINTLCNPSRNASAHYVATGTGRRVACLVSPDDTAWHAGTNSVATNPNPHSIGIECDPRCRDEDYDVVAELIANIRSAYGDLPLRRHSDFVATQCPGNWNLSRLDALARTKDGSGDWGDVHDIVTTPPPVVIPPVISPIEPPIIITPPVIPPTIPTVPTPEPPVIVQPPIVVIPPIPEPPIVVEPLKKVWWIRLIECIINLLTTIIEGKK